MIRYTKSIWPALLAAATFCISGCAGSPSVELVDVKRGAAAMESPASKVLVMALYPDKDLGTRTVIENALVGAFRQSGIESTAGYKVFETYAGLDDQVDLLKGKMQTGGFDALVIVDPIRAKAFDPGEYAARRSAYRALGLDSSASFNLIGQMAAEADAAKAEMDVLVWDRQSEQFVWHAEYDLNAPGGYELEVAREYASEFGKIVAEKLKSEGLVR